MGEGGEENISLNEEYMKERLRKKRKTSSFVPASGRALHRATRRKRVGQGGVGQLDYQVWGQGEEAASALEKMVSCLSSQKKPYGPAASDGGCAVPGAWGGRGGKKRLGLGHGGKSPIFAIYSSGEGENFS